MTKSDFLLAITQLSAEKNLPKEVVIAAIEAALVSAYRKDNFAPNQNITVKINPTSGKVEVWAEKAVVLKPVDQRQEISLSEARAINPDVKPDDLVMVEATPRDAGRIAAQTAKQVILQRLHEAEHSAIYEEYNNREGDVVTAIVHRIEAGQIILDLGRTEAILPANEQVRTERYRIGQKLKVLIHQVVRTGKGPRVIVSRSHPDFLRRLFELEVPEIASGQVEIASIAREAGFRSKVAVRAMQEGLDPVGCCVGLRGIRIQNVVAELSGEKIDVILWHQDPAVFIANALSPANIASVMLDHAGEVATVVVPDKQLSLAIGKEGQNARLAAKLTGWRIDIKSAASVEAAKLAAAKAAEAEIAAQAPPEEKAPEEPAVAPHIEEIPVAAAPTEAAPESEAVPAAEVALVPPEEFFRPAPAEAAPQIRFAEDILAPRPVKTAKKTAKTKKKKGGPGKEGGEDGIKIKKARRGTGIVYEEDEEY